MANEGNSRVTIDDDNEDRLFRIFDGSQGLQRRVFRMLSRGFFNSYGVAELRSQAKALIDEIDEMEKFAKPKG
jgi:hypothetical protein